VVVILIKGLFAIREYFLSSLNDLGRNVEGVLSIGYNDDFLVDGL